MFVLVCFPELLWSQKIIPKLSKIPNSCCHIRLPVVTVYIIILLHYTFNIFKILQHFNVFIVTAGPAFLPSVFYYTVKLIYSVLFCDFYAFCSQIGHYVYKQL